MDKIASKTYLSDIQYRETELVEISQLPYVFHNSLHMQECRNESEIYMYNYKLIQLLNHNKLILNGILGVCLPRLDCNVELNLF